MDDKLVLLSGWASSYGIRVQIALAEKGIDYEFKEEGSLLDKSPFLLEMNPIHKKIPVLIHNGKPICESNIIIEYIDELWSDKCPLLPSDPYQRSQARFWADFVNKKVYSHVLNIWNNEGEKHDLEKKEFLDGLKTMEEELGDKTYFGGESFGIVDVALISLSCWFYTFSLDNFGNISVDNDFPKLSAWVKRCMERESVANSLPDPYKAHEYLVMMMKKAGIK